MELIRKYNMPIEENIFFAKRKLVDNVYKSANLEGISVTFAQTEDIFNNVNVGTLRPDEIIAVLNLRNAWYFIFDNIAENISIDYIKKLHELALHGTNWRPKLPSEVDYYKEFKEIMNNDNLLERSLDLFLWIQRSQMFRDGNKRVANLAANHEFIKNGLGIIAIPVELTGTYKQKLVNFYETNDCGEIKQFLYDNCLDGI